MKRLQLSIVLVFACVAPAFAQQDNSSEADRQAQETYSKNAVPPVPAANLGNNLPADTGRPDIDSSADAQAAETYDKNVSPIVPSASHDRASMAVIGNGPTVIAHRHPRHARHHSRIHHGHWRPAGH